jgi:hypothetical protein
VEGKIVAEKTDEVGTEKAKSAGKQPAVIRQLEVANDEFSTRMLNRHVPALVISGAIHVVVITCFLFLFPHSSDVNANQDEKVTATQVEDAKEKEENLTNEDIGFDPDLAAATNAEREENVNVDAKATEEAVGLPDQQMDTAPQTAVQGLGLDGAAGVDSAMTDAGVAQQGLGGGGSAMNIPGMKGRSGATKDKLLKAGGGNSESEAAVARGLAWLARQQLKDGSWEFDGGHKNDKIAATGMALLPFLAAGQTHKRGEQIQGKNYVEVVRKGLDYLKQKLGSGGNFTGSTGTYSHAIATIALCEAYGMEKGSDAGLGDKAKAAVYRIVNGQGGNGSWGYAYGGQGDTSIVGWQIQALQSANLAGLLKPGDREKAFKKAESFLNSVASDSGAKYGYTTANTETHTLSAVGLLSRYYIGWTPRHPAFGRGVEYLKTLPPPTRAAAMNAGRIPNMYYYYYATQVVHFFEGKDWFEFWNPRMRDSLIVSQNTTNDEKVKGSWAKDGGSIGSECGRLGTTCLALLTLEVYYRHLPLYKRDNAGLMDLERGN